jgi:hypothetical protein
MEFDLGGYQSLEAAFTARVARHPERIVLDPKVRRSAAGDLT